MAERTDELSDYTTTASSRTNNTGIYPNDTLNRVGTPDVNDDMLDPLDDTVVETDVTVDEIAYVGQSEPALTETEILQTRAQIGQTIDAIQDKLRPQTLAQQAKDAISDVGAHAKDTLNDVTHTAVKNVVDEAKGAYHGVVDPVKETVGTAVDSAKGATMSLYQIIRQNPIPLGMAALGLYWFYRNMKQPAYGVSGYASSSTPNNGYYPNNGSANGVAQQAGQFVNSVQDKASDVVGKVQDKASDLAGKAQDTLGQATDKVQQTFGQASDKVQQTFGQATDKVQQKFGQVSDKAQQTFRSGQDSLQRVQQENPLVIGAVALVAGAAIGMMLPPTDVENRMMGEARDRLADQIGGKAQDLKNKVGAVAQQVVQTAGDTVKQEAQNQGLSLPQNQAQGGQAQSDQQPQPEQSAPEGAVNEVKGFA